MMILILDQQAEMAEWYKMVSEAEKATGLQLDEEVESYLVFTLMRYVARPEIANRVLALDYLEAVNQSGALRDEQLRDVGDQCLLFSGLFPKRAERRRVRISYYVDLGRSAYHNLAGNLTKLTRLYNQLARNFVHSMDILQAIRQQGGSAALGSLQALELWQDTGSQQALSALRQATHATPAPRDYSMENRVGFVNKDKLH